MSSSSSSSSREAPALLIPAKAALPPATENGVDATAVPNTLAVFGTPKAAKSVTTFLGGELGTGFGEEGGVLTVEERSDEPYEPYEPYGE